MKRLCRNLFTDPVFQDYRPEIQAQNFQMLRVLGRTAAAVSLVLVLAAWNVELAICSKEFYFSIMAAGIICMVLCYFWPDAARRHSAALLVLLGAVIMTVAIISGTAYYPEGASGAVPAFLCIVPFAVLIPLGWFYLFEAGFCALFAALAFLCKTPEVAVIDILNGVGTMLISCIIGTSTIRGKLDAVAAKAEIIRQRDTDHLTGILSRGAIETRIRRWLQEGQGDAVLIILDMDRFKQVNDTGGHLQGDRVLIQAAEVMRTQFRSTDCVARLGGDEFMIFLPEFREMGLLETRLEELNQAMRWTAEDGTRVSASIGATVCHAGETFEALYRRVDRALYRVKENGRDGHLILTK